MRVDVIHMLFVRVIDLNIFPIAAARIKKGACHFDVAALQVSYQCFDVAEWYLEDILLDKEQKRWKELV